MSGAIHPLPQYAFMAWCLVKKHRDNFTFFTFKEITKQYWWHMSRDNSVVGRWATGWMIGYSNSGRSWEFFSLPPCSDWFWGLSSLLSNGYQGHFPWGQRGRDVKLTTHLHLPQKSRMRGAIPPVPNTPSWRGAQLKNAQGQLCLYIHDIVMIIISLL
jgi:hypothetical protein